MRGYGYPGRESWSSQSEGDREVSPEMGCPLFKKYGNDMKEWAKFPTCQRLYLGGTIMGSSYCVCFTSKF